MISIPVSYGELIDKLTILDIKRTRISDPDKLKNIIKEHDLLSAKYDKIPVKPDTFVKVLDLHQMLREINEKLWEIEDKIRECERMKDYSDTFIQLARSVYLTNDKRSQIKKQINDILGSNIVEEKSYTEYA